MRVEQAERLLGINLIPPETLANYLGTSYSEEEKRGLADVPIQEPDLLKTDPYDVRSAEELRKPLLIKETHLLIPPFPGFSRHNNAVMPIGIRHLFEKFGFAGERGMRSGICFYKKSEGNKSWENWIEAHEASGARVKNCWQLVRKDVPSLTVGKNYQEALNFLKTGYRLPTVLEVLVFMAAHYFWLMDKSKSDQEIGLPLWADRNIWARLLYSKCTWTSDEYQAGEKLVVGLNDASGGIYIFPLHPAKRSYITGVLPVRDLKN